MFKAILIDKDANGYRSRLEGVSEVQLPEGDVRVRVDYSTLNYKDALAITGKSPVVRTFPMVPGIDFAGTVEESRHPAFQIGDRVLLNGWGVGEKHWGGLAQKAQVQGDWLLPIPAEFSTRDTMAIGTAGYTAMLCLLALERQNITPEHGPILVTGANGGVGSFAIALLSRAGYQVVAATGRPQEAEYLHKLGAQEIIERASLSESGRPLQKERWAGAIDTLGSHTLANVCASLTYGGVVAACGLAQGMDFPATVAPFILRGITLVGVDSVMRPQADRQIAWQRLAQDLDRTLLQEISHEIGLNDVIQTAHNLIEGRVRGRILVNVNA